MAFDASGNWYPKLPDNAEPVGGEVVWRTGNGVPDNAVGRNGDGWIRLDNGDIYTRNGDVYELQIGGGGDGGKFGEGSPEGVVTASPGTTYVDTLNHEAYWKESGSGNVGWRLYI